MKTAEIPVYGHIALYMKKLRCLSKNRLFPLRCLDYICSAASPLRWHGLSRTFNSIYLWL